MAAESRHSITTTLGLTVVLCTLACAMIAGEVAHRLESDDAQSHVHATSERTLDVFVATSLDAMISEDRAVLLTSARQLLARTEGMSRVLVTSETGAILAEALASKVLKSEPLTTARRVEYRGQKFGTIALEWDTKSQQAAVDARSWRERIITASAVLIAASVLMLIVYFLLVRPVRHIHERAVYSAAGVQPPPARPHRTLELHSLSTAVERLATSVKDLRAHEAELEQAQVALAEARDAALEASSHKSSFLAMLSHELKTPLNSILGFSQLLQRSDELDTDARNMVATMYDSGNHLLALVDEMLDFAAIDAGRLRITPAPLDWLRDVIEPAKRWVEPMAETAGIGLILHVDGALGEGNSDQTRARQIVTNIIHNAVKFTDVGNVEVFASVTPSDRIAIRVVDSGIGLDEAAIERIFEPFVQADHSSTRRHGGTGLGLAICRRVCIALGGNISVASTPGDGSTFTIELPRYFAAPANPNPNPQSQPRTPDGKASTLTA